MDKHHQSTQALSAITQRHCIRCVENRLNVFEYVCAYKLPLGYIPHSLSYPSKCGAGVTATGPNL